MTETDAADGGRRLSRRLLLTGSAAAVALAGVGVWYWPNRWRYIVVHHTAGDYATIEFLQQVHRERQAGDPVDAIPYHYVIGNGNGLAMGEIASDWRREMELWGAHLSTRNSGRNLFGIGICLVGNFEKYAVPARQFDTLVELTKTLMRRYGIPPERVAGHGHIDGESTRCPGRLFPLNEFRQAISRTL